MGSYVSEQTISSRPRTARRGLTLSMGAHWPHAALVLIAALAAVLNFYGLSREGYNNEFYAAAVRSMSESWHNFFFNSFDPGGFVTIDKPPLGFWFQVASVKLFGFNGVSLLIPEALAGVLSVLLLYYLVSRTFGRVAGSIAALALAITPISVVTSRNNTIDSILVLFVLLGAWAVLRAAETGRLRWLLLCALFVGLGFNIKMLEAYLVVPAFGLVFLLGARIGIRRRIAYLTLALVALLAVSLSWAAAVDLTPAGQRPWVDSTSTNSELDLAIGYNGLQRLTGNSSLGSAAGGHSRLTSGTAPSGSSSASTKRSVGGPQGAAAGGGPGGAGGGPGGIGENGPTGVLRLLDAQLGSQIGWLLSLAVIGFLLALWQTRPRLRTLDDRQRSLVLWGVWLLTTGVFFSIALFYHTYYLVMVAPAVAALAGIGIVAMWQAYRERGSRTWWVLPVGLLAAGLTEAHVLSAYPSYRDWLTPLVLGTCAVATAGLILFRFRPRLPLAAATAGSVLAVLGLMTPPAVFAAYTTIHTQTGNIVRAGPQASGVSGGFGGPGGFGGRGTSGFAPVPQVDGSSSSFVVITPTTKTRKPSASTTRKGSSSAGSQTAPPTGKAPAGTSGGPPTGPSDGSSGPGAGEPGENLGPPPGGNGEFGPPPGGSQEPPQSPSGSTSSGGVAPKVKATSTTSPSVKGEGSSTAPQVQKGSVSGSGTASIPSAGGFPGGGAAGRGGFGGPGGGQASSALIHYLVKHRGTAKYIVATPSSNQASPIVIATGLPVMSMGGFSGSDPILTTARLAALARAGAVKYFLIDGNGGPGGPGGPGGSSGLTTWIQNHSKVITVAGTQLYEYTG